jgi:hypothetical protein
MTPIGSAALAVAFLSGVVAVVELLRRGPAVLLAATITATGLGIVLVSAGAFWPASFEAWMQEDEWAEWATVFVYLAAAGTMVRTAYARRLEQARLLQAGWILLALFCVAIAAEEVSWGQRLLAFKPPEVFLEKNFQQELNLHNLLKGKSLGAMKLDSRYLVALVAASFGLLAPALCALPRLRRLVDRFSLSELFPRWVLAPFFALVAVVCLDYPMNLAGEAAELSLGTLFLAHGLDRSAVKPAGARAVARVLAHFGVPLLLGVLTPMVVDSVHAGDDERSSVAAAEIQWLALDARAALQRAWPERNLHKRVFTALRERSLALEPGGRFLEGQASPAHLGPAGGEARRDRKGYFLDPWNNPYWVRTGANRAAIVYSFGPNRRRDSSLDAEPWTRLGDDLWVDCSLGSSPP